MAGDKTYITDGQGKLHRATRVHAVTPTDIVWSSNPNDYTVQVKIDGKWHRAVLTMDAGSSTFFDNINIDKALVTGADGKQHTALIVNPESTVTLSDIKTDTHGTIAGTTTGETAVSTYSENWSDVKWQDNVNVYKVLVTGSDGKVHTALLTTSVGGGVQVIVLGPSPLLLPDAIANSLQYVKAFGGTEQRNLPDNYIERQFIYMMDRSYLLTDFVPTYDGRYEMDFQTTSFTSYASFLGGRSQTNQGAGLNFGYVNNVWVVDGFTTGSRYTSSVAPVTNTRYKFIFNNQVATLTSGNSTLFTNTFTGTESNGRALAINGFNNNGSVVNNNSGIYLYSFKAWNAQGELIADYVPAVQRGTVPVVGFYDTVSKTFKTATAGTFAAGGEAVPTPDAPMDIVSNNGVLKARHQSGLPLGYTLLEYIESTGTQYIDTNITGSTNAIIDMQGTPRTDDVIVFMLAPINATAYANGFGQYQSTMTGNFDIATHRVYNVSYTSNSMTVNGVNVSVRYIANNVNLALFGSSANNRRIAKAKLYSAKIYNNDTLLRNFIPARRDSDGALGMYDMVSGQFFTNAGTGDFVAGNPVSDPVEVYTDGLQETIGIRTRNLFNKTEQDTQYYYGNDGSNQELERDGSKLVHSAKIPCKPNTTYVLSGQRTAVSVTAYYKFTFWDANGDLISYINNDPIGLESYVRTATTPSNCAYIAFNSYDTDINVQLEEGSTATAYIPYNDSTAVAEMLLKLGTYTDQQEIIDGTVTRKVGIKVLDGTEDWTYSEPNTYGIANLTGTITGKVDGNTNELICSHFGPQTSAWSSTSTEGVLNGNNNNQVFFRVLGTRIPSLAAWQQWLAAQYAAGTPVIVVYPLATETTESVAGQTLQVQAGDNVLEITQASLSGLELEAEYTKVA